MGEHMKFNEILQQSGMTLKAFSDYFEIPYRTVQNWKLGVRACPPYLLKLIEYKLKKERI